jgi:hypothetical protein
MNILYSFETEDTFKKFGQSHRIPFCTKELEKLTWIEVAKLAVDGGKIEIYDRQNAAMFLFGICDVHPKYDSLCVGLLYYYY